MSTKARLPGLILALQPGDYMVTLSGDRIINCGKRKILIKIIKKETLDRQGATNE